ncbi:alpha-2-macroglobulin-like, partial [Sinocyclocheilus rhinocerous]|uniref:alpha-2-macroglobulin-like n=1 Tax=Sinocyclocheilus rhinocerous TaxID=307959 RepID=UPI0007B82F05
MAMKEFFVWKGLILVLFLFAVDGQTSGPSFLVTFSAVIKSGSIAKLCASLLKPNESLALTIYLVDDKNRTTQLVQQRSSTEFHHCFSFQAPRVDGELVQKLRVVLQGRFFKMTEERKVMFRRYLPLTFIQTDKPIYNPGQMVNFRAVTMDAKFVPLDQMVMPDLLLVLPKFDITLTAPQMYSVGDVGLKVEACANYTYGQPVPGQALVEVCREPFPYAVVPGLSRVCLIKTAMMNNTGCVSLTISTSEFFNTKFENDLQDSFLVNLNVTEEGTDVMMSKSTTVSITFEVGKVTFLDLPGFFAYGSMVNGKISASYFNRTPIASKAVYLLDRSQWPNKLLLNLTTNMNGLAAFSLNTADLPKAYLNLVASATSQVVYGYKSPYFSTDTRTVPLFQTSTPNNPTFSELTIVKFEQPLKCGAKYPVTIKYSFVGETGDYSADILYMVLSRGVIVL